MRRIVFAAVGSGLFVASCGDSGGEQQSRPINVRSEAQDQLHNLSDMNRHIALRRAIYDAGASCPRVEESGYVQEYGNVSMWTASCSNGQNWAVFVAPDGTAQLRRCEHMEQLNLPRCEIRGSGGEESGAEQGGQGNQQQAQPTG